MNTPARWMFLPFALSVVGCAHLDIRTLPTPDAKTLLQEVDELDAHTQQVKGAGRLSVSAKEGGGETGAFIAVRAPGDLHLELLNFFGAPAQVLVSDGRTFGLFQSDKGTYLHGPATAAAIARILPVTLSSSDLVAILLGRTPRLAVEPSSIEMDTDAQAWRVHLQLGERGQTVWIHPASKRVMRSVLTGPGAYTLLFEHPLTVDGVPFPRKVTFTDATATVVLRWNQDDLSLEGTLDPALFTVRAPPGAREVDVTAGTFLP